MILRDADGCRRFCSLTPDEAYWVLKSKICYGEELTKVQNMPKFPEPGEVFLYQPQRLKDHEAGLFTDGYAFQKTPASRNTLDQLDLGADGIQWV